MFPKPDDDIQTDFSDKRDCPRRKITVDNSVRYLPKSEQTKQKNIEKQKNVGPNISLEIYRKK